MDNHNLIPQIDGNGDEMQQDADIPENWDDEELEDYIIGCKLCDLQLQGKSLYNFHIDTMHGCRGCRSTDQRKRSRHKCPYKDFIVVQEY